MNNIQNIVDNYMCSACGACGVVCPHKAISYKWSNIGRKYAAIDTKLCVDCGLCTKVCPSVDTYQLHKQFEDPFIGDIKNVYIGHSADTEIYANAQSGGVCTAIIKYLFDKLLIDAAVVCKMTQGPKPIVSGIVVRSYSELIECQKSCYTPVDILSALKYVGVEERVAIVGIPCHIQAATNLFLTGNKFKNIKYKLGLICDRTLCDGIQDVFSTYSRAERKSIIWRKKDFYNRETYYPYSGAPVVIEGGGEMTVLPRVARTSLKDKFTAPRCRVCYDKLNTHADIVLGDPWGMDGYDKNKGDNVVISRSTIGDALLSAIIDDNYVFVTKQADASQVISGQAIDKRRKSVSKFSLALSKRVEKSVSYLLSQCYSNETHEIDIKTADSFIQKFLSDENRDIQSIVKESISIIEKKQNPNLIKKLFIQIIQKIKS